MAPCKEVDNLHQKIYQTKQQQETDFVWPVKKNYTKTKADVTIAKEFNAGCINERNYQNFARNIPTRYHRINKSGEKNYERNISLRNPDVKV